MGRVITIQYAMLRSLERRLDELIDEISALLDEGDFRSLPRNAPATATATSGAKLDREAG
jgi:hypothetical protein